MTRAGQGASEAERPVELYGLDDGGWFRTGVDWIGLCEALRDMDVGGCQILRSLVCSRWSNPVRKLTLEELRQLIPSPGGGPSGLVRVRDLLRNLTRVGLVTTPEGRPLTTSSCRAGAAKPLRIRVNDVAPEGYPGWRHSADTLVRVQAPVVESATGAESVGRTVAGRKSAPGGRRGRISVQFGRKADSFGRNSDSHPGRDLRQRASFSALSPASSLSGCMVGDQTLVATTGGGRDAAVEAISAASAHGAGRSLPPESIRGRLTAQVPELTNEFAHVADLQVVAQFAGERRWVDLGRAALHPDCERALAAAARLLRPAGGRGDLAGRGVLLAELGVAGTGL